MSVHARLPETRPPRTDRPIALVPARPISVYTRPVRITWVQRVLHYLVPSGWLPDLPRNVRRQLRDEAVARYGFDKTDEERDEWLRANFGRSGGGS